MKDIKELKCDCGAKWGQLMWLNYRDTIVEENEIYVIELYECELCEKVIEVEHIATTKEIKRI